MAKAHKGDLKMPIFKKSSITVQQQMWKLSKWARYGTLINPAEMSNRYRGHSIDVYCPVSVNLAKRFQRRRFLKIGQSETRIACGVW